MLLHIIADYGNGDLAFSEVVQKILFYLPDAEPNLLSVPPFSTLAAGFCIAQLGLNDAPEGTLIYHNVAPRRDDPAARNRNAGERLTFARLSNGVRVIGVNAGYTFSFVRSSIEDLRLASVSAEGSQFRSRDLFPRAAAAIAFGHPNALGESLELKTIPEIPSAAIAYIDGYGNIKTTIPAQKHSEPTAGSVRVRIGNTEREAITARGSFQVPSGKLAFSPGSSGWTDARGNQLGWMELFLRDGSAWKAFGSPEIGAEIQIC
jgi:hypothetical protein